MHGQQSWTIWNHQCKLAILWNAKLLSYFRTSMFLQNTQCDIEFLQFVGPHSWHKEMKICCCFAFIKGSRTMTWWLEKDLWRWLRISSPWSFPVTEIRFFNTKTWDHKVIIICDIKPNMSEYIPSETNQHSVLKTNQLKFSCLSEMWSNRMVKVQTDIKKTYY